MTASVKSSKTLLYTENMFLNTFGLNLDKIVMIDPSSLAPENLTIYLRLKDELSNHKDQDLVEDNDLVVFAEDDSNIDSIDYTISLDDFWEWYDH